MDTILELRGITKNFGSVIANNNINLAFRKGEVHCLLGENGAGKTTLMNVVFGLHQPDQGQILVDEKLMDITSPSIAIQAGIGMVHQNFMLVDPLTVAENIVLGQEPTSWSLIFNKNKAISNVDELSRQYSLKVDPSSIIEHLPLGIRQRVEILKALYRNVSILILDEPTAVLSPQEVEELYTVISALRNSGKTVIFITHKLKEAMTISDRITVLRDGKVVGTVLRKETTPERLAYMMVGRNVVLRVKKKPRDAGKTVLSIRNLFVDDVGLSSVQGINLDVREGEILGIAGIEGNGQRAMVEAVTGLRQIRSGSISLSGMVLESVSVRQLLSLGIGHVPEDRSRRGLIEEFMVAENIILGYHRLPKTQKYGILLMSSIVSHAKELVQQYDIRTPSIYTTTGSLSGGNQQKMILARALSTSPKMLVVSQPTRGLDVAATEYIHNKLLEMRSRGIAILLVSANLEEIFTLSDRIAVMYQGEIVGEKQAKEINEQQIGYLMAGGLSVNSANPNS